MNRKQNENEYQCSKMNIIFSDALLFVLKCFGHKILFPETNKYPVNVLVLILTIV